MRVASPALEMMLGLLEHFRPGPGSPKGPEKVSQGWMSQVDVKYVDFTLQFRIQGNRVRIGDGGLCR
eukprot:5098939-Pyramimonas_sp.AAC.1